MNNIFTRNLKNKAIALIASAAVFGVLYLLSMTLLNEVYLFEWTARNLYCYIWAIAAVLIVFDKLIASYAVTIGNLIGVLVGQLLGDLIISQRMKTISSETTSDMEYLLSYHYGAFIWAITILVFIAIGITVQIVISKRGKTLENKIR